MLQRELVWRKHEVAVSVVCVWWGTRERQVGGEEMRGEGKHLQVNLRLALVRKWGLPSVLPALHFTSVELFIKPLIKLQAEERRQFHGPMPVPLILPGRGGRLSTG